MNRRRFLSISGAGLTIGAGSETTHPPAGAGRLFFTSQGRTAMIHADGTGLRWFDFNKPDQVTWQPGPFLSDGKRVIFLSMEARRDGPGKPFDQFYHRTPTRLWIFDLERDRLDEICTRDRLAVFYTPALLVSDERILVQVVREGGGQIRSMNLDGSDAREFTRQGEGLPYGLSLSPDGRRVAWHLAAPDGYQIWTSDLTGGNRVRIAAHPDHLYFGPVWSRDGQWLAFSDCRFKTDPGHDWCDICVAHPDGSGLRAVTEGQAMWFAATWGHEKNKGGGSNVAAWTRDGQILFPMRQPDSKVPWEYQARRPDTDHFNRDFKPADARGRVEIGRLNPANGAVSPVTRQAKPAWDFRASESPDGRCIAFCRAETGGVPALWTADADGGNPRLITRGFEDKGAEHPRWLPVKS